LRWFDCIHRLWRKAGPWREAGSNKKAASVLTSELRQRGCFPALPSKLKTALVGIRPVSWLTLRRSWTAFPGLKSQWLQQIGSRSRRLQLRGSGGFSPPSRTPDCSTITPSVRRVNG